MKLNHDCVREVLLSIESKPYGFAGVIEQLNISEFSDDDVRYAVEKLVEIGFIIGNNCSSFEGYECIIRSLSYDGHEFLDNIRPQEVWDQTKSIVSKVGSASLDIFSTVAAQVITNLISKSM